MIFDTKFILSLILMLYSSLLSFKIILYAIIRFNPIININITSNSILFYQIFYSFFRIIIKINYLKFEVFLF